MSLNSESKSKRSFKSISSNPCSSGNNSDASKGKKRKNVSKTIGVAWSANSRPSSRSNSSPFSDFGSYMNVKNQKLHEQFNAAASSSFHGGSGSGTLIFCGVSIFVDGYTVPSSQELRGYMLKFGGKFENYFSRQRVTHIICSNLPDSKIKNFRAFSRGLPVVKPTWVLDSVAANKLLSWTPYQLAVENNHQPKLSAFFPLNNCRVSSANADAHAYNGRETSENDSQLNKGDSKLPEEISASEREDSIANGRETSENDSPLNKEDSKFPEEISASEREDSIANEPIQFGNDRWISEEPTCSTESSCEPSGVELIETSPLDGTNTGTYNAAGSISNSSAAPHNYQSPSSKIHFSHDQRHSTLTDPNFVENYFKSSRLHFIGTWRNRYRKRFARPLDVSRSNISTPSSDPLSHNSAVIHIDMDSFFVSVVIRNRPELHDKPVAVSHSDNIGGTAEISSANYPARNYGVKAGMFVRNAKILCPLLVIVPYDFGAYEKAADQFYDILHKHCNRVQAVSCDEAFLDVSESEVGDPQILASTIRKEIYDATGCTASAGIAGNMLMARLATRAAKPDGQCYIPPEKVDSHLSALPVKAVPGIGHIMEDKLKERQIETCGELRQFSKDFLQKDFGMKTGEMLWNYCRGIDNRQVGIMQESKSIGAEVNWGVRFRDLNDTHHFLKNLCKEVSLRLQGSSVQGRSFTLKIKKRRSNAGEPVKYMGHGDCENLSHSVTIPMVTDDVDVLQRVAIQIFGYFNIDVEDIRGVGLQVSKLEAIDDSKPVPKRNSILSWLVSGPTKPSGSNEIGGVPSHIKANSSRPREHESQGQAAPIQTGNALSSSGLGAATLPPLHDLDMTVIESLPPEVVSEINGMYGGKLLDFISKNKVKAPHADITVHPLTVLSMEVGQMEESPPAQAIESNVVRGGNEVLAESCKSPTLAGPSSFSSESLMPSSLSQIDRSVFQQLPKELREDIIELLPKHRTPETDNSAFADLIDNQAIPFQSNSDLWIGNPPYWVQNFEISNCRILNIVAKIYRSGASGDLSSVLQRMISTSSLFVEMGTDEFEDAVRGLFELIKQYIELKIGNDIEEIYYCVRLLEKLTRTSKLFIQVYSNIVPHLQASVGDNYGGTLHLPSVND